MHLQHVKKTLICFVFIIYTHSNIYTLPHTKKRYILTHCFTNVVIFIYIFIQLKKIKKKKGAYSIEQYSNALLYLHSHKVQIHLL